ncbi:MAG: hypothetical protein AB2693_21965 [Candidatus Thiodiazotropha sp.]
MTTMQDSQWIDYHPIASLDSFQAPIEFVVPGHTEYYTDLSQTWLYLKFRILKEDGSNVETDAKVGPVNNFLHSMFSGIDLYLNNKLVTNSMDTYPYRAYMENLFSFGSDAKENQLKASEFWYEDTAAKFEDFTTKSIKNRIAAVKLSKAVELQGRLHLDLAMQEKYLPNGVEIKLRLNRSSPRFSLMAESYPCKVKIDTAILSVRNIQLLPAIANDLNQSIAHQSAKYPVRRVEVKTFTIGTDMRSKVEDHLFQGQLPKRLFIGMVSNEAFNGSFDTNPFFFQHFNLSKLDVSYDGHSVYGKAFEPKFDMNQYLRSYMSLYQALGSQNQLQTCNIDYDDYKGGYCFWGYDLTPDQGADQSHLHPIKTGNLRLEFQFASKLEQTINVIVYAEFDSLIEINGLREVTTDF